MSRSNLSVIAVLILIIAGVGFYAYLSSGGGSSQHSSATTTVSNTLQPTGSQPYTTVDGQPVDLADYAGDVLVVNSWASWCPFCVEELPAFAQLAREYEDAGVEVIAINRAESPKKAEAFIESEGLGDEIIFLLDENDPFYSSIGGFSMPETVFYHHDGSIAVHKRGVMELPEMRQHVETALSGSEETE